MVRVANSSVTKFFDIQEMEIYGKIVKKAKCKTEHCGKVVSYRFFVMRRHILTLHPELRKFLDKPRQRKV